MDGLRKMMSGPTAEVDRILDGVYHFFSIESMAILSGENIYHTRIFILIKNLETLCKDVSAVDLYTTLRQIYLESVDKLHFMMNAKLVIEPRLQTRNIRNIHYSSQSEVFPKVTEKLS